MGLSAVVITFNEEKNIGRCLDSLQGVADEIVVVDSNSQDKTTEICAARGIKVVSREWLGYAAQKNFGNSLASNDWILSLDADEAISGQLKNSILREKDHWSFDAYEMNRLTNYCGKWIHHCGWYPDRKLRLFNSKKGRWGAEIVHEEVSMAKGASVGFLEGDLLHYSFYSRDDHFKQIQRYSSLTAQQAWEKGKKAGIWRLGISPLARFVRDYFLRGGILDGFFGLLICWRSAFATYLKYKKLRRLWKGTQPNQTPWA